MKIKNKSITSRDEDFAKWYTDVVTKAKLASYSNVKGFVILEPNGYAIWENIQKVLDNEFKKHGHQNVYLPLLIPETLLEKEKEHVEGFAPEVAWVTFGGKNQLEEKLCIRPTSETLFCDYFANSIRSYRDLPKLYNQWCNIIRWEKETRPFLRTREFLWQEGHTIHETSKDAIEETDRMLMVYKNFFEDYLAIPVIHGRKTEKEKFAGAEYTLTIEALMYNGVSLQSATSHYLGQKFTKPFEVEFTNKEGKQENPYQTAWGSSTRMIGALIMVHGDDNGLILPPKIAPKQVVIVPISKEERISDMSIFVKNELEKNNIRCFIDNSDRTPGFKFAEHEMNGIPLRLEIGPRDIENNQLTIVRRDNYEKSQIIIDNDLFNKIEEALENIQKSMYNKVLERNKKKTYECHSFDQVREIMDKEPGFIKAMWCGDENCELKFKEIKGMKSRCIADEKPIDDKCICCGKKADKLVYWGIQY